MWGTGVRFKGAGTKKGRRPASSPFSHGNRSDARGFVGDLGRTTSARVSTTQGTRRYQRARGSIDVGHRERPVFGLPVFGFLPETSKACASPTPIAIACTARRRTQPDARHAGTTWRRVQTVIASNIAFVIDAAAVRVCGATGRVDWVKQVDGYRTNAEAFVLMTRGCGTCAKVMLVETPRKSSQRMCHRRVRRAPSKACRRCVSQASP